MNSSAIHFTRFLILVYGFIAYLAGSPADRSDLEVGDEILEVNGKSLQNASHAEVIRHIHQASGNTLFCPTSGIHPNSLDNKGSCWILLDFYCSVTMLRELGLI